MSEATDYYNSTNRPAGSSGTASMVIPEITSTEGDEFDPCAVTPTLATDTKATEVASCYLTPEQIAFQEEAREAGLNSGVMCSEEPPEDTTIQPSSILLRPFTSSI